MRSVAVCLGVALAVVSCTSSADASDEQREIELFVSSGSTDAPDALTPDVAFDRADAAGVDIPTPTSPPGPGTPDSGPDRDPDAGAATTSTGSTSTGSTSTGSTSAGSTSTGSTSTVPTNNVTTTTDPTDNVTTTTVPTTTVPTSTTIAPAEVWRVGLVNTENAAEGSYPSFRIGVAAAVNWRNGQEASVDQRTVELVTCRNTDAVSAAECAADLVATGVDAVIRGVDLFQSDTAAILDGAAVPTLGGIAWSSPDARSGSAALTVGGPVATHAGLAAALVAEGFGSTVVVRDDTADAAALVSEFIAPVLDAALVSHVDIAVPNGTVDATDALAPAVGLDVDSWIVVTSRDRCAPVIRARSDLAVVAAAFYGPSCLAPSVIDTVGPSMERSFFVTELVSSVWHDVVPSHLRDDHVLATAVLGAISPEFADDELALAGHVAAVSVMDALDRNGPDLGAVRDLVVPHPMAIGQIDCGQSPTYPAVCSADVAVSFYIEGSLVGPPAIVNGLRGR